MKPYLDLLKELRDKLVAKGATANRTAVKAVKVVGRTMRFDLTGGKVPMVTTKKLHLKSIVAELLWFLSGDTNNETLAKQGVRIWNEWSIQENEYRLSPEEVKKYYIDALCEAKDIPPSEAKRQIEFAIEMESEPDLYEANGIKPPHNRVLQAKGNLGPLYGKQWRNFPAAKFFKGMSFEELGMYIDHMTSDQKAVLEREAWASNGKGIDLSIARDVLTEEIGIDQISQAIYLLKTQPNSRRNLTTSWNPQVVPTDDMSPQDNVRRGRAALAACHAFFQFITEELTLRERFDIACSRMGGMADDILVSTEEFMESFLATCVNVPTHRLNCSMYQRKVCALAA